MYVKKTVIQWPTLFILLLFVISACRVTSHPVKKVSDKPAFKFDKLTTKASTTVRFKKYVAAEWIGKLEGLINLDHEKAQEAGLKKGDEPLQLYFYTIDHPTHGRYLIDTGVSEAVQKDTKDSPLSWAVKKVMNFTTLKARTPIKSVVDANNPIKGIFMTHLHLDHVMGFLDLPLKTPIYIGKNEASKKQFQNIFVQGTTDEFLEGHSQLEELQFTSSDNAIDFFKDGSLLIFNTPGHTAGTLSFLIRSKKENHLIVADTSHTIWGWNNAVGPGEYTMDKDLNQKSLEWLINFTKESTEPMRIHLGHQDLNKQ
jgi:glyoxylase-like metal-dependent hydrolase (beta-lactamase superfamily II)